MWVVDDNELYAAGSKRYRECMVGDTDQIKQSKLVEKLKDQTIVNIHTKLYDSIVQTQNKEPAISRQVYPKDYITSALNGLAVTAPNDVGLRVSDRKDLKLYDDCDYEKLRRSIYDINEGDGKNSQDCSLAPQNISKLEP